MNIAPKMTFIMSKFLPLEAASIGGLLVSSAYNEEQRRCSRRWIYLWGCMADRPHAAPALLRGQAEGPGPKI